MVDPIQAIAPQLEITILGAQNLPLSVSWEGGPAGSIPRDVGTYLKNLLVANPNSRSVLIALTNIEVSRAGVFADVSLPQTELDMESTDIVIPVTLLVDPNATPGPVTVNLVLTASAGD